MGINKSVLLVFVAAEPISDSDSTNRLTHCHKGTKREKGKKNRFYLLDCGFRIMRVSFLILQLIICDNHEKTKLQCEGFSSWIQVPTAPRNTNNQPTLVPHRCTRWSAGSASGPERSTRWPFPPLSLLPVALYGDTHPLSPPLLPPAESQTAVSSGPSYITAAINHAPPSRGLSLSWGAADMRAATSLSFSQTGPAGMWTAARTSSSAALNAADIRNPSLSWLHIQRSGFWEGEGVFL